MSKETSAISCIKLEGTWMRLSVPRLENVTGCLNKWRLIWQIAQKLVNYMFDTMLYLLSVSFDPEILLLHTWLCIKINGLIWWSSEPLANGCQGLEKIS